jgi:hypothetical protein
MAAITIDFIDDWITRLRGRVYAQCIDSVSWGRWVEMLGRAAQDWENAAQTLFTVLDIDNSVGPQLATIGRIIGQVDPGLGDATYRVFLKARIQANRSTGGGEDIYKVFRALYGETIGLILSTSPVKTIVLRVKGAITPAQASYGIDFLRDSKEAGVRALFEFQEFADDSLIIFSDPADTADGQTLGPADIGETFGGKTASVLQA